MEGGSILALLSGVIGIASRGKAEAVGLHPRRRSCLDTIASPYAELGLRKHFRAISDTKSLLRCGACHPNSKSKRADEKSEKRGEEEKGRRRVERRVE